MFEDLSKDPMKVITLEMIFHEMRVLASKIQHVKEDIIIELQRENTKIKKELKTVKEELSSKSKILEELQTKVDNGKSLTNESIVDGRMEDLEREKSELQ